MNEVLIDQAGLNNDTAETAVDVNSYKGGAEDQTGNAEVKLRSKPRARNQRDAFDSEAMALIPATLAILIAAIQAAYLWSNEKLPFLQAPLSRELQTNDLVYLAIFGLALSSYLTYRRVRRLRPDGIGQTKEELAQRLEALEDKSWEIRESEEIHRSLAEAFGDVVLHRDHDGAITFKNKHFDRYFDQEFALPKSIGTFDTQRLELQTRDLEIETRLGTRFFAWTDLIIRDPDSGQSGLRSVARDITDRKTNEKATMAALEQARKASESKSQFLAMVSHEIRTPLNGVIGMAKLLEDTRLDPTQASYVESITKSGRSLLGLIEDLLDTTRIEAGQLVLQSKPTDLRKLVEDVADILGTRARERGIDLATFVDPNLPTQVELDPDRLRQILLNLAGNAVKFTEKGGVAIFVEQCGGDVEFTVSDTGPGLSEDDQGKIFEDFAQASTGATRAHEGAGLGLSISRKLVGLMGAEISVESKLSEGSHFRFSIPATKALDLEATASKRSKGNVLLFIEKTPASLALEKTLHAHGYRAHTCVSGHQFRKLAESASWKAVIADRGLLTHSLVDKVSSPVFLLGDAGDGNKPFYQSNIDGWLTWPVRAQTLLNVLEGRITKPETRANFDSSNIVEQCPLRVLLAEDNPINAMLVTALLSKLGHQVTHVENGRMAVDEYSRCTHRADKRYDLVFMDLHMPELDGSDAIVELRALEVKHDFDPVKIFVLSADGQREIRDAALEIGANDFLLKPLDLDAVTRLLDKHHT